MVQRRIRRKERDEILKGCEDLWNDMIPDDKYAVNRKRSWDKRNKLREMFNSEV